MKKISLCLLLLIAAFAARANSVGIQNFLSIPLSVFFWGVNPDGTTFTTPYVTIVPGFNYFANPSLIPGATGASATGRVVAFAGVCEPYDLALGSPNLTGPNSSQNVPNSYCNNGVTFDMYWNEPNVAPFDAFINIF